MQPETLDGHYGVTVSVDLCHGCAGLWFDRLESLALTPGSILRLFVLIHENRPSQRNVATSQPVCPRCGRVLVPTVDSQRGTRFSYARCPNEHGRFITFVEFLREKNFVRPLGPRELADLRDKIRTVHCSSCGAPVDLAKSSTCGYCHAPISALDTKQVESMVAELRRAETQRQTVDPTWPLKVLQDRIDVDRAFAGLEPGRLSLGADASAGLVEAGVAALVRLLRSDG
jgi:hypothetical protein